MPKSLFERIAEQAARIAGSKYAFAVALSIIAIWAVLGPRLNYSDTWQLVINTGTTIVTFLMVFLLQNSTNREGRAVQVKLDELIRSIDNARNEFIAVETKAEAELEQLSVKGD